MRSFDLICNDCRHRYCVESESPWIDSAKHCPKCGSDAVHQTFKSYARNGALYSLESANNARYKACCCRRPPGATAPAAWRQTSARISAAGCR